MPSTSKKQHNFMAAVANNPKFAKKAGVPQSVGKEFTEADKGKKFSSGDGTRVDRQGVNKPKTNHGDSALFKKGGQTMATKMGKPVMKPGMSTAKDGMKKPTPMAKTDMAGSMMGMKKGGMPMKMKDGKKVPIFMNKGGMKKMAAGGLSGGHKAADGVASKGKTKGTQITMSGNKGMKSGGYC
jgi:hypothetical protein